MATLSQRQLNRATLQRQLLLNRSELDVAPAVAHLAGLQAQEPAPPYAGLWTRLANFRRDDLHGALHDRLLVRATGVRGTLHTVTAADYLTWRPALEAMLADGLRVLGSRAAGVDVEATANAARQHLRRGPMTFDELRALLLDDFPHANDRALGYAARMLVPLVMVPTDDRWSFPSVSSFSLAQTWLGKEPGEDPSPGSLVLRYLAAFGPATVADFQTWSGLRRMAPTFDTLGSHLRSYGTGTKRLYDLADAELPDADTPAPVRFLPSFDSVLLAHDDRSRIIADEHRPAVATKNLRINASVLVDGRVAGLWKLERRKAQATVVVSPFARLPRTAANELGTEGTALAGFLEPDATTHDVRIEPVP